MSPLLLAIDQGTTGTTVLVINDSLEVLGRGYAEFPQHFPRPGWVEHDPEEIWASVKAATKRAFDGCGVSAADIAAIGITNQRETTMLWDRHTGEASHKAIVWQCRRTADICATLRDQGHEEFVRSRTGLVLDPYFSGTKIQWLLDHADLRSSVDRLAFGTVDSFLLWRLTGGEVHATDPTNASRTLLFDLHDRDWSDELCDLFKVPRSLLPQIKPSSGVFGTTAGLDFLPDGIPIAGIAGDQQSALFGQACFEPGDAKCTYGTGAFLLLNTGTQPVPSSHGLLTTVAWWIGDSYVYALEGSAFIAGAAVQWLRDGLGMIEQAADIEALARTVDDSGGVVFVPALAGLGAPHWRPQARGVMRGIDRGTTKAHLARAVLDGIALQNVDILKAMEADAGQALNVVKVDGGAAANDLLMQLQSDLLDRPIVRPQVLETTALGAACLAGLGIGIWNDPSAVADAWTAQHTFTPSMASEERAQYVERWNSAIECA